MKHNAPTVFLYTLVLTVSMALSGCSGISDSISGLNPFQQTEKSATPPTTAPANQEPPVSSAPSIRVEAKPLAPRQREVEVNVGGNKQCTTFCALPMRKPPVAN